MLTEVSTEEFWEAMCNPKFCRIDFNSGVVDGKVICTTLPPETVDGFINDKINRAVERIKGKS